MMQDEQEDYGEEASDVIAGLRRLARDVSAPTDILPHVLARGEERWSPQQGFLGRWWRVATAWQLPPVVWGPVVAAVFFMAGVFAPLPHSGTTPEEAAYKGKETPSEQRVGLATQAPPAPKREVAPPLPATPPEQQMRAAARRDEPLSTTSETADAPAKPFQAQRSLPSQIEVSVPLPTPLYEQLWRIAQRRQEAISTLLREAVEAYLQGHKTDE